MQEPAASIRLIVPTRNCHRLLSRLVDSLQRQTLSRWQVSFIDASDDEGRTRAWLDDLCRRDPRFSWTPQQPGGRGIYGAMNQGFNLAGPQEWLLFWGSDDWAAGPTALSEALTCLEAACLSGQPADLLITSGRYHHLSASGPPRPGRRTAFHGRGSYRQSLLLGSSPPHQATLIGPGARRREQAYREDLRLAADLDYFLRLSRWPDLRVRRSPIELVHMGDGGVSGQQTARRLSEVRLAYQGAFGRLWPIPYAFRYLQRLLSKLAAVRPST